MCFLYNFFYIYLLDIYSVMYVQLDYLVIAYLHACNRVKIKFVLIR